MQGRLILFVLFFLLCSPDQISLTAQSERPGIYVRDDEKSALLHSLEKVPWKKAFLEELKQEVDQYVIYCEKDPTWLVSRLQMNWKTKHDQVFLKGGKFSHSDGEAPVPTVRFSGTRDWATDYQAPDLAEVEPYFDDPRGMHLAHKDSGVKEWVHPSKTGHIIEGINRRIMKLVRDAAFLYWLTGEEKYARFAAPVFTTYIEGMYHREAPYDLDQTNQQRLSGLATFEVIHERITVYLTLTYDFLHDYLQARKADQSKTVEVFQRWADQIIVNGVGENNWNFFQAEFLIHLAVALDDNNAYANGKGQQYYLDQIFEVTTDRQIALKESVLVYDQATAIWPESASYSMHVTSSLLEILTLFDHAGDRNAFEQYPIVEKATLASFQYLFPTGYTVGFGDSDHDIIPPEHFEMLIAHYRKYGESQKENLMGGMLQELIERGAYERKAENLFQLFFYVDELGVQEKVPADPRAMGLITPTFYAPGVSMFLQRVGEGRHAVMTSTVGAYGNHAHANGISLELFANNYVLGPDMGRGPSYWHPEHREYYSQFPAHNTVAVNGQSTYRSMLSYHPYTLDHYFPEPGEKASFFDKLTFCKTSFIEPASMASQQRFTTIIQSESGPAYVVDIFRSEVRTDEPQKHEYFYHNLGQSLSVFDRDDQLLDLPATQGLSTEQGDLKAYDYFTDKYALTTSGDVRGLFRLKEEGRPDNLMKLWVKGAADQTIYSVKAPPSNALSEGTAPANMLDTKLPTLVLKRDQAAWKDPFVVLYNPYLEEEENVIADVQFETMTGSGGPQRVKVRYTSGDLEDQITANASVNDIADGSDFYQKGLFSLIRHAGSLKDPLFLFVSGVYKFDYGNWQIISIGKAATVSLELTAAGIRIQNNEPVYIRIPRTPGEMLPTISLYENGEKIAERSGVISRLNPDQVEFRLAAACEQALIKQ